MSEASQPRILSIPAGVPFLSTLVDSLLDGTLVPGFAWNGDPLLLSQATIYVPTRRAARALRAQFVERLGGQAAILPVVRPLGEFEEDLALFDGASDNLLDLAPPIPALDRMLLLAPLVQGWKRRLPGHLAALYDEEIVVPASFADALWLARDLAGLMDEIETDGADWTRLSDLVPGDLANWWQITLEFLDIVTRAWPDILAARDRSSPAAHRNATILAEAARLTRQPPAGPVIAAGSTGSIPATAKLLDAIARLPLGAVVLPGLDDAIDPAAWTAIGGADAPTASFGHPQTGLKKLLASMRLERDAVTIIGQPAAPIAARMRFVNEALRPAETTDLWVERRDVAADARETGALDGLTLIEAANQREEALAVAIALRLAVEDGQRRAALVTGDRELARRVASELRRFGIEADDSGGALLAATPPATLLSLLVEAVFRPGDPVPIMALVKHPLLQAGMARAQAREAAETLDLVVLRGGVGRPDIATLDEAWPRRWAALEADPRKPFWLERLGETRQQRGEALVRAVAAAIAPLVALREADAVTVAQMARASVESLEALCRDEEGTPRELYRGDNGEALAAFLRELVAADGEAAFRAQEWPQVLAALLAGTTVKPSVAGDTRVAIWGTLEARLQNVDMLVLGSLNEGSWPRRAEADRFMSRMMKSGLELEPPERRIGQAAHDFVMAMGTTNVVISRAARVGDAPAVASRWLQRLVTFAGKEAMAPVRARGATLLHWARELDAAPDVPFAPRPCPKPDLALRPRRFSITEIETLRRDPYAIYARKVLGLFPLEPLLREPGAAERGSLMHDILHRFILEGGDPAAPDSVEHLLRVGRACFDEAMLPPDIDAVWWPRFARLAGEIALWERERSPYVRRRLPELRAASTMIGATGVTIAGRADRIDAMADGTAAVLDFKTGSYPSRRAAHTLIAPQLALEGALLLEGAFEELGVVEPSELAYVRLKANGRVEQESILKIRDSEKSASELSREAWARLEALLSFYQSPQNGYLSRALPMRAGDVAGDYDHLARVLEWSAGGDSADIGGEGEP